MNPDLDSLYDSYTVVIVDTETGERRTRLMDLNWYDHSAFWWSEGNFGCDCNRKLEFEAVEGVTPDFDNAPCSVLANRYKVHCFIPGGETLYKDDDFPDV